jgi:hypothetical protein
VEHVQQLSRPFPWRAATVVVGALALLELVALLVVGATRLASPARKAATAKPAPTLTHARPVVKTPPPPPSHPLRARAHVPVLVLNGNGRQGAAGEAAQTLETLGYRVRGAENAPRHDYARSMVMYVPGWAKEARRLGHDTGIRLVTPVDGLTPSRLKGSRVVLLLGS